MLIHFLHKIQIYFIINLKVHKIHFYIHSFWDKKTGRKTCKDEKRIFQDTLRKTTLANFLFI